MIVFWLSLILALVSCVGLLFVGKGYWWGWALGIAVQPVWAIFAIITHAYGLLLSCGMFAVANWTNLRRARSPLPASPATT